MKINKYYDLSVFAASILGSTYRTVQLVAILGYESAKRVASIDALHKQVYKYLPQGTPSDHTKYTYYQFKDGDDTFILAEHWIIPNSVKERNGLNYTVNISNVTNREIELVRESLTLLGITFTID